MTPEDLKKTKLFVSAGRNEEMDIYRSVGCKPVALEVADILPSLQTGLIDTVALPPTIALALQVDKAAPHMLEMNWAPLVGACIMSKKVWDGFSPAEQEVMRKAALEAGKQIKADGRRECTESVEAMQKRGLTVHNLTPEVNAEWDKTVADAAPMVRGKAVPADIYDEVVAQLKVYRAQEGSKK